MQYPSLLILCYLLFIVILASRAQSKQLDGIMYQLTFDLIVKRGISGKARTVVDL